MTKLHVLRVLARSIHKYNWLASHTNVGRLSTGSNSKSIMNKTIRIPGSLRISDVDTELAMYDESKDFKDVFKLAHESSRNSTGVDQREFPDEATVRKKLDESNVLIVRDKANGNLVSAVLTFPSTLVRSTKPLLSGGYLIVNENYRGVHVGYELVKLMMSTMVPDCHKGLLGRTAVTARSVLMAREVDSVYLGMIPKSLNIPRFNQVVDDIIVYFNLHPFRNEEGQKKIKEIMSKTPAIPPLEMSTVDVNRINSRIETGMLPLIQKLSRGQTVYVAQAEPNEYVIIEEMIRQSAMEGRGIGLDEFTDTGLFNRKLLRTSHAIVARLVPGGPPVGVVVFGTSAVCRVETKLMNGYIVIDPSHRSKGIGTACMKILVDVAKSLGYEGLLIDVYQTESETISWSKKMGFCVTGSLPECGFVKGKGFVDALLLYREFKFDSKL